MKNLLIIPFAYKEGANTGVNIRRKHSSLEIYLKNCCVALVSAKQNVDSDTDCAIVTNMQLPSPYHHILANNGIKIIIQDFDCFNFGDNYRWSLAFYKLCALYRIVRSTDYDNYAYLDSDVIVQSSFSDIWTKCSNNILMYDLKIEQNGDEYKHIFNEAIPLMKSDVFKHYGGEFFAARKDNALKFSSASLTVFNEMIDKRITTTHGDEFIISLVAESFYGIIADAKNSVCRIWTGTYRYIPNNYSSVAVLHLPAEKEYGIIRLFKKYIARNKKLPNKEKVYSICHIYSPSLFTLFKIIIKYILKL